ncbi:hypothetical protein [Hyalangium minutum]|uniref:Uncharacterized protein n=1 Tax=Hyalangium minutum TaxID=394096 RepID=A0A085WF84_9BACT|nr:hypothetical protein [Hyalangium minutum]KFE66347.1 hypothetical protein DB31_0820 [Hyalangium minutum]
MLQTLGVGAQANGTLRLPVETRAGEYRILHEVDTLRTDSQGRSVQEPVTSNDGDPVLLMQLDSTKLAAN